MFYYHIMIMNGRSLEAVGYDIAQFLETDCNRGLPFQPGRSFFYFNEEIKMQTVIKTEKVTHYIASDGRDFLSKSSAEHWENSLIEHRLDREFKDTVRLFHTDLLTNTVGWFMIKTDEQVAYLKKENSNKRVYGKLEKGDWFAKTYKYNDDGERVSTGLMTLRYVMDEMTKFQSAVRGATVDGKY